MTNYRSEAEKLVDELFRNGAGAEATRLVLVKDNGPPTNIIASHQNLGGWCKAAVLDRVTAMVDRIVAERDKTA